LQTAHLCGRRDGLIVYFKGYARQRTRSAPGPMSFSAATGLSWQPDEKEDQMPSTDTRTKITQLGTVMVPVSDQDRALDFYVDKLGFEKRTDIPYGEGDRWLEVSPPGAATTIALVPPRAGDPTGIETRVGLTTEDVDTDHANLRERGVDVDAEVMRMGDPVPPMFFFRDQDGNRFMVVERS
jgi:catechol 2,3-dioxygenase-like lactoylglutathione lyase family enzyme